MLDEPLHSGDMRPSWGAIYKVYVFSRNMTENQYFIIHLGCSMPKKSFWPIKVII